MVPEPELAAEVDDALDQLDGLLLVGGIDVDPGLYGARRHPRTQSPVGDRDRFELALIGAAWERRLPVLGICRGMQLMNVALGGTLYQHLPDVVGHQRHRGEPDSHPLDAEHDVRLADGSLAAQANGTNILHAAVSRHHQGVAQVPAALRTSGWTVDELPVAIEARREGFFLGVQWHPEQQADSPVFAALTCAAVAYREGCVSRPAQGLTPTPKGFWYSRTPTPHPYQLRSETMTSEKTYTVQGMASGHCELSVREEVEEVAVDPALAAFDRAYGRVGGIRDVNERPHAGAIADQRELALADHLKLLAARGHRRAYNVVDDDPAPVADWLPALAEKLAAPKPWRVPRFVGRLFAGEAGAVMMTEVRGASNAKAKRELGWQPQHSSWREGFAR